MLTVYSSSSLNICNSLCQTLRIICKTMHIPARKRERKKGEVPGASHDHHTPPKHIYLVKPSTSSITGREMGDSACMSLFTHWDGKTECSLM